MSARWLGHFDLDEAPFSKAIADNDLWVPTCRQPIVDELVQSARNTPISCSPASPVSARRASCARYVGSCLKPAPTDLLPQRYPWTSRFLPPDRCLAPGEDADTVGGVAEEAGPRKGNDGRGVDVRGGAWEPQATICRMPE